jgi:hypothetical protein
MTDAAVLRHKADILKQLFPISWNVPLEKVEPRHHRPLVCCRYPSGIERIVTSNFKGNANCRSKIVRKIDKCVGIS